MRGKKTLWVFLMALTCMPAFSQSDIKEKVYLHLSSQDLLVGQTLRYAAYVTSLKTGNISEMSKILYVELLNEDGQSIHREKLHLKEGRTAGKFFIPSVLPTSTYRLVAYTRWMKNFEEYETVSFTVINPYEEYEPGAINHQADYPKFYFEGGNLVSGNSNLVVVDLGVKSDGSKRKARVTSQLDEKVAECVFDDQGLGTFYLTPKPGEKYQLILDIGGEFEFHQIPEACDDCQSLKVTVDGDEVTIAVSGNSIVPSKIEIHRKTGIVKSELWKGRELTLNNLTAGSYQAQFLIGDEVVSRRIFNIGFEAHPVPENMLSFGRRQKVAIPLNLPEGTIYSVSVNRKFSEMRPFGFSDGQMLDGIANEAEVFDQALLTQLDLNTLLLKTTWGRENYNSNTVSFLPEYRFDLVQGVLLNRDNRPITGADVLLSTTGGRPQLRSSITDSSGNFVMEFVSGESDHLASIEVMMKDTMVSQDPVDLDAFGDMTLLTSEQDWQIFVENEYYDTYPEQERKAMVLDSARVMQVVQRGIWNQIENAYFLGEPADSLALYPLPVEDVISYKLDDYTRFASMRDTFIEYIPEVGVSRNESNFSLNMRTDDADIFKGFKSEPILLLDGILISSKTIFEVSPYLIEQVDILPRRYIFGDEVYEGLIALNTYKRDHWKNKDVSNALKVKGIMHEKTNLHSTAPVDSRLPDYREVLFWNPHVVAGESTLLEFYSSDVQGLFEVQVEGVTTSGKAISLRKQFAVD